MNLEELTKHQIILLTLLVSFVTSIFTGIVTVRLLEQAPAAVTQTINRVVERTVERVVPVEVESGTGGGFQTVVEKETTVVVKEDDLITESIANNRSKIVRLFNAVAVDTGTNASTSTPQTVNGFQKGAFQGIGLILSGAGLVATDVGFVEAGEVFVAETSTGALFEATVANLTEGEPIALLALTLPETNASALKPLVLADSSSLKLGQTVIALGGEERTNVSIGIITELLEGTSSTEESQTAVSITELRTNISASMSLGSPLINIFGEVVGIKTSNNKAGDFTPMTKIKEIIAQQNRSTATEGSAGQEASVLEGIQQ